MKAGLHALISGKVQGVFFRAFVKETAKELNLTGWVKNNRDGTVELIAEGKKENLKSLLGKCKQGPPSAEVKSIKHEWQDVASGFESFEIKH